MKEATQTTSQLREVLRYVRLFRNSTFVIAIDGSVLENNNFIDVANDIALLREIGIGIVLVIGFSTQPDHRAKRQERRRQLQTLAGELCRSINEIWRSFSKQAGSEDTKSWWLAIEVNATHTDPESLPGEIRAILDRGLMPVFAAAPNDKNADKSWFRSLLDATFSFCRAASAEKLIYLSCVDGIFQHKGKLLRQAQLDEIYKLVRDNVITGQFAEFTSTAEQVITNGVQRVHFINGKINGALLHEVFTNDGIGTMIHQNPYQEIRPAAPADISGILNVLRAPDGRSEIRHQIEKTVKTQLANYRVAVKDNRVVGCGCLRCFPSEKKAFLSSFAIDESHPEIRWLMLEHLFNEAKEKGTTLLTMVSPHTGQWWLGQKFTAGKMSDLPTELQACDNPPANVILVRQLES